MTGKVHWPLPLWFWCPTRHPQNSSITLQSLLMHFVWILPHKSFPQPAFSDSRLGWHSSSSSHSREDSKSREEALSTPVQTSYIDIRYWRNQWSRSNKIKENCGSFFKKKCLSCCRCHQPVAHRMSRSRAGQLFGDLCERVRKRPLTWWKHYHVNVPTLCKRAQKCLRIPATSCPSQSF